uniref:Uncharacterized protein n=1 Tax=Craspedostauros australis TaxID=1486917 RepID=A0A7R9WY89_9STRA
MYHLVTSYGLVVPVPFETFDHVVLDEAGNTQVDPAFTQPKSLKKPYLVDPAIQLLCVWLLEGGKRVEDSYDFLERTLFPFEALSTQIVGSAITAATTVAQEKRKRIQSILKDTLNMQPKSSSGKTDPDNRADPDNKTDHVQEAWDALEDVTPVSVWSDFVLNGMYHQQSAMSLNEPTIPTKPENFEEMTTAQVMEWMETEKNERLNAREARMRLNRWDGLETKQVDQNFGNNPRELASSYSTADGFDASRYETLVTSLDMDKKLIQGLLKMREACANLEDDIPHSDTGSFNPTKQNFCPSLTTVAEGSSNLADGYVSTAGVRKITDSAGKFVKSEVGFFTVCIQAKDYFDSSTIKYENIRKNRDRVYDSLLSITFGSNRLYCVASREDKLYLKKKYSGEAADGTSFYVGFPTDKSPLLTKSMDKLDERRRQSQKTDKNAYRITTRQDMNVVRNIVSWMRDSLDKINTQSRRGKENNENAGEMDQFEDEDAADDEEHDVEPDGNATRRDD